MKSTLDLLIPIYNGRPYFDSLLADIGKVKHHFARIVFYDDASKDGSANYLKELGHEVICGQENRGQAYARNALLAAASSQYVHFHDMDDPLAASFFEIMVPQLEPSHITVGRFIADYDRHSIQYHFPPSLKKSGVLSLEDAYNCFIHLNSVIFPRAALAAISGFRPELRIHEDRFLFFCLANSRVPWRVCEEAVARQWCHPNNTCSTVGERYYKVNWIRYFELAFKLAPPGELQFLYKDVLRISQELLRDGESGMAKRGFMLCDELGVENFPELTPKARWFCKRLGFYDAYRFKRAFGRKLKFV